MKLDIFKDAFDGLLDIKEPKRFRQIAAKILRLINDPFPNDSQQLQGFTARRLTVGEYRVIYRVDEPNTTVEIILIGKRNDDEIYRELKRKNID